VTGCHDGFVRILITNDDGIDSRGLHVLACTLQKLEGDHELIVLAPDREFSGAGAALGALHLIQPEVRRAHIDGFTGETWALNGPPALCVMFSRLGAFGPPFDLVVSGINPGANVGRSVYHSGTIGATLTARNGNISGVAVSQSVTGSGIEGQAWDDVIADLPWETAAEVAREVVQAMVDDMPTSPVVVNLNVPDTPLGELRGWRLAEVGLQPPRAMSEASLEPIPGHDGAFRIHMGWGEKVDLPDQTDGGTVENGFVSVSYLTRIEHAARPDMAGAEAALDRYVPPR
jgi:5'-nucleotidase